MNRAVAGGSHHNALRTQCRVGLQQRANDGAVGIGMTGHQLDAWQRIGPQHPRQQCLRTLGGRAACGRMEPPDLAFFHTRHRAGVARIERIHPVAVNLGQVLGRVHQPRTDHHTPSDLGMTRHGHGIQQVLRAIGHKGGGWAHRAGEHHRLAGLQHRLDEKGSFFQRVGAVCDHNAGNLVACKVVREPKQQPLPQTEVHVLAVHLVHLLHLQWTALQRWNAPQKIFHTNLPCHISHVISCPGGPPGDRSASPQDHAKASVVVVHLPSLRNCLKIQILDVQTACPAASRLTTRLT